MFSFGRMDVPQFGGVGVMIEPPNVEVAIRPATLFAAHGDHVERARRFVETAARSWKLPTLPRCEIDVRSPHDHAGLGVGTQLGLAIAAGLQRFTALQQRSIEELAAAVGRSRRSAVGTYGFKLGGLIVDAGRSAVDQRTRLARRVAIPSAWRFVLVRPLGTQGLAGDREVEVFAKLPPVPEAVTRELWRITKDELLPAVEAADCRAFGDAVYRFGRLAGKCFATAQGGPFASLRIADLVAAIRDFGVPGVGQSSWGPTVFAIAADDCAADRLVRWLRTSDTAHDCEIQVARPNNCGATVKSARSETRIESRRGAPT
jgi:beta-RFAP synthase